MSKVKTNNKGGAQAPPAPPELPAIVVTAARTLDRYLPPGTIIPHPSERELKLCREGAAEPLAQWWPALAPDEPQLADGKRYPVVLLRPGGELWVRLDARTLRPLNDCSLAEAILALGRTANPAALEQAALNARHPSVRQAAKELGVRVAGTEPRPDGEATASTAARPTGEPQPVAIGFSGGRWPAVILDNGKEVKPAELYESQLLPLIASCEHKNVLEDLAKRDQRANVKAAAKARLAALAAPPPPPADETKTEVPPPEVKTDGGETAGLPPGTEAAPNTEGA